MANTGSGGHGGHGASRLGQKTEASAGGALGTVQETAQNVASSVAETAQDVWDSTRHGAAAVADTACDAWDEVTGFMKRYPLATFVAGLALGALLVAGWGAMPGSSGVARGMGRSGHDPHHPYGT